MVEFLLAAGGFALGTLCGVLVEGLMIAAQDRRDESEAVRHGAK